MVCARQASVANSYQVVGSCRYGVITRIHILGLLVLYLPVRQATPHNTLATGSVRNVVKLTCSAGAGHKY